MEIKALQQGANSERVQSSPTITPNSIFMDFFFDNFDNLTLNNHILIIYLIFLFIKPILLPINVFELLSEWQTEQPLIRRRILRYLPWSCNVCSGLFSVYVKEVRLVDQIDPLPHTPPSPNTLTFRKHPGSAPLQTLHDTQPCSSVITDNNQS